MGFKEAVNTCLVQKYATFSGRAARSEYWYFVLFYVLVAVAIYALFFLTGGAQSLQTGQFNGFHYILFGAYIIFALAIIIPSISVAVRRLHDRNMSGWWFLGFIVASMIPFVGFLVSIGMLVLFCLKGTDGPNRFGDDPLNPSSGADVFA